jgi:hypothetical protein
MKPSNRALALVQFVFLIGFASTAVAQDTRDGVGPEWAWPRTLDPGVHRGDGPRPNPRLVFNGLPSILVTGYWPPTNEMLRPWSPDPTQNGGTWIGENWRGMGYNVYAYFPEFPGGTSLNPRGNGDFEVDYQDTSADWWFLLDAVRPIGIITNSRDNTVNGWDLEGGNGFYANSLWTADYLTPFRPTDAEPHDPPGSQRFSSQPMQAIVAAVAASGANVMPFISAFDNGRFLSNYIGYHGNWWKDTHNDPAQPDRCYTAGHIHIGQFTAVPDARLAFEVTLEVVLAAVDLRRADGDADGDFDLDDIEGYLSCIGGPDTALDAACARRDNDQDLDADMLDLAFLQARLQ